DSTNIIHPILSMITNISLDHTYILGDTLEAIANEKAGIIKKDTPVVISEKAEATSSVFIDKASSTQSKIVFASDQWEIKTVGKVEENLLLQIESSASSLNIELDLPGTYQTKNIKGVLSSVDELRLQGFKISEHDLLYALNHVKELTGLRARWQTLSHKPLIICDTGHNEAGWSEVL